MRVQSTIVRLFCLMYLLPDINLKLHSVSCSENEEMPPRIGIIGAGLSGTSAAFFLRSLFGKEAKIDIFETGKVGGRTAVININGVEYEAGGSVIHAKNRYMVEFVEAFQNNGLRRVPVPEENVGLYGDEGLFFQTSDWSAISLAKVLWRYGLDIYTIQNWTSDMILRQFYRIYDFQDKGMAFTTVEDMLRAMGEDFLNMTRYSMKDVLRDAGLSDRFIEEFAMASARVNYGQTTDMHGFVGAVSMCGIESGMWSVSKGNHNVARNLLLSSAATLIDGAVHTVALIKDGTGGESISYEVDYEKAGHEGSTESKEYDIVIVATPLEGTKKKISFVDFPVIVPQFSQPYHTTVAMLVQGRINKTTFNLENVEDFPLNLLTVSPNLFFNSIGHQTPVTSDVQPKDEIKTGHSVWKTFLNKVPTQEQIDTLFDSYDDLRLVDWLAYPEYKPGMDLPPFMLYDRLYYVNAVESAAAAMEMNVIGAKNVALLAYNQWRGHFDKIDEHHLPLESQTEDTRTDL